MEDTLESLIILLYVIDKNNTLKIRHDGAFCINQPIIAKTINMANTCLINSDNSINNTNINVIKNEGFHIYVGDIDNNGWNTGIIELSDGDIVFG